MAVDSIVATMAIRREMIVALVLGFLWAAQGGAIYWSMAAEHWPERALFVPQLTVDILSGLAIVVGSGAVRISRLAAARKLSDVR
jgi:hypothetical protein